VEPYYTDDQVTLWHGDSLEVLRTLPAESVNCVVTSPPYFGLRDYGEVGQYGLEASPSEYVEVMRSVFGQARRVLAKDGTLWLNLGDSYAGKANAGASVGPTNRQDRAEVMPKRLNTTATAPYKGLLGIPWRTAFALQDDGWILRSAIVWDKPNAMPESVTDRPSTTYEMVFMFTQSPRYWFDLDAIREPHSAHTTRYYGPGTVSTQRPANAASNDQNGTKHLLTSVGASGRNPGDVWSVPTQPFSAAHFAVMPRALAERCIKAGCRPGGVVLDPFAGSGTTGMVALKHGRRFVGVDLSAKYLDLALKTRLAQTALIDEMGA
jgi:site-specific DNA-methyltransferase (cytosine-N4-specific)